jgi:hypothetical protein
MSAAKRGRGGPPAWLVFLVGVALVFGLYYVWLGLRNFLQTGGLGVMEATERAIVIHTATAERIEEIRLSQPTARPTSTPIPACQDFVVIAPSAIVRERPSTNANIITSFSEGTVVCVVGREPDTEWYLVDANPRTRRFDPAYMHDSIIRALNRRPRHPPVPHAQRHPLPTSTPSETAPPCPRQRAIRRE